MRRYLFPLLCLVNIALCGVLAWLWVDEQGQLRHVTWSAPAMVKGDVPVWPEQLTGKVEDASVFLNIIEKPLFSPSRRPPPPPPPPTAPPPPDPLQGIQMVGVFGSGPDAGILATIEGRMRRVAKGDKVGEWSLKAVSDRTATFVKADEQRVVDLRMARLSSAPANAPQPAAQSAVRASGSAAGALGLAGGGGPSSPSAPAGEPPKPGGAVFGGSPRPAAPKP